MTMRRADRLFEIIQVLRRASGPMTGDAIAEELETSRRTIYRDIAALMAQRVPIRGEAGVGYVLDRGFDLPPLMLTVDETEAVALGCQWVVAHGGDDLAKAALAVLAKVAAIVPENLRPIIDDPAVGTPPTREDRQRGDVDLARLRQWSRTGRKLRIGYVDETGASSERVIWPFMVGYVATVRVVMAWCELKRDFRIFRTDRMNAIVFLDERYPEHSVVLRGRWLAANRLERAGTTIREGHGHPTAESRLGLPILWFETAAALDGWIAPEPRTSAGVWLRLAKKGAATESFSKVEAIDVALCHGWIDGQQHPYDENSWLTRFTPRRPGSRWSQINRMRALELIAVGCVRAAGLAEIEGARGDGRWEAACAPARTAEPSPELRVALDRSPRAAAAFSALPGARRYAILYAIATLKTPAARARRIARCLEMLECDER